MATIKFRGFTALIGGGIGALDAKDGADLADKDGALVVTSDDAYMYTLDNDSGAAESSPDVIAPDTNPGAKRWILVGRGLPNGVDTGDIIRYNSTSGKWERKAEPLELEGIILTPLDSPISAVDGALYYNNVDKKVYVARDL